MAGDQSDDTDDTALLGRMVSHYRIIEKLGFGGMGVVYRAQDTRLDRHAALKFLPAEMARDEQALERFEREARAASALNHPHICTIYDFGEYEGGPFMVMELLAGSTLKHRISEKPLPPASVIELGAQIADGLETAHAKGILHRDIKPANIFVTDGGQAKLLDFGLAKIKTAGGSSGTSESSGSFVGAAPAPARELTATGALMGTAPYMSPEQIRGEQVDARSDVFSLGAVLYEMATSQPAFQGETNAEIADAILSREPVLPRKLNRRVPSGLERVIVKALQKKTDSRYQRAGELRDDLLRLRVQIGTRWQRLTAMAVVVLVALLAGAGWRLGWFRQAIRPGQIRSLAVLPLVNLSGDPKQDYFADGMTEQLTADLGQISALRVISRTSAMRYKRTSKSLPTVARELNVNAVVEGSVERAGRQVRITAQLIEAPTDRHLWARSYERDVQNVLNLQKDVAEAIANEIRVKLTPQEQTHFAHARAVRPEAHEAYLRGLQKLRGQTGEGVEQAIQYFQHAIALDPNEALAYAGLADAYRDQTTIFRAPLEVMPKSKKAAARAIELDDTLAAAHASLGYVKLEFDWDWPGAEREFRRALELNPNEARALSGYAQYCLTLGRIDEAIENQRRALAVDPLVSALQVDRSYMLFNGRRYERAIEAAKELGDDRIPALAYAELGRKQEAIAAADRAIKSARSPIHLAQIASVYAKAGKPGKARAMLSGLEAQVRQRYICGFNVACVYAALGDKEKAFAWLEKAYLARSD
jgi:TolB-like protein/Tfp pilus assembly protein PilF